MSKIIIHELNGVKFTTSNIPTGMKWGRGTIIERVPSPKGSGKTYYSLLCECGNTYIVYGGHLVSGHTASCGCYNNELLRILATTHGDRVRGSKCNKLYDSWVNMLQRCSDEKRHNYHRYGGRGIAVCTEWKTDYEVFKAWALANGYSNGLTIDRINNDLGYSPSNCRWATMTQQNRNRRDNHLLTAFVETKSMAEWVEDSRCVVGYNTLRTRITTLGWLHERAITEPSRPSK